MKTTILSAALAVCLPVIAWADFTVTNTMVTDWKAVFGRVEARDTIPARARLGGTLISIGVEAGTTVDAGEVIATIDDVKLGLQLLSIEAEIEGLQSQLENARSELERGEGLLQRGVTTTQRLDALRTQVSVLENRIVATGAQKKVIEQRRKEGAVLAPVAGTILTVPVTTGAVVMPGEVISMIAGGGFFLRLGVPERHAQFLKEGIKIQIGEEENAQPGTLAKVYPQIQNGRVIADVEVDGLSGEFVDARVLVRLPVGQSNALLVPVDMVLTKMGLDFVTVKSGGETVKRAVVPGEVHMTDNGAMVEILSGLKENDILVANYD